MSTDHITASMDFVSLCLTAMKEGGSVRGLRERFEYPFFVTLLKRLETVFEGLDLNKLLKFFHKHDAHVFGSHVIEGLLNETYEDSDIDLIFPASVMDMIVKRNVVLDNDDATRDSFGHQQYTGSLTDVLGMKCPQFPCPSHWSRGDHHCLIARTDYGLMYNKCLNDRCKIHKNLKLVLEGYLKSGKKINVVFVDIDPVNFIMSAKDISLTHNVMSFKTFVLHSDSQQDLRLREFTVPELTMDDCPRYRWWIPEGTKLMDGSDAQPSEESQITDGGWYEPSPNLILDREILASRAKKYRLRGFTETVM